MNKILPTTVLPPDGKRGWSYGAYTLAFVYSSKGNFVLKGYYREVKQRLNALSQEGTKWFVNLTLWHRSYGHRSIWDFWKDDVTIMEPSKSRSSKRWEGKWRVLKHKNRSGYGEMVELEKMEFKRMPKKWIPEFDKL